MFCSLKRCIGGISQDDWFLFSRLLHWRLFSSSFRFISFTWLVNCSFSASRILLFKNCSRFFCFFKDKEQVIELRRHSRWIRVQLWAKDCPDKLFFSRQCRIGNSLAIQYGRPFSSFTLTFHDPQLIQLREFCFSKIVPDFSAFFKDKEQVIELYWHSRWIPVQWWAKDCPDKRVLPILYRLSGSPLSSFTLTFHDPQLISHIFPSIVQNRFCFPFLIKNIHSDLNSDQFGKSRAAGFKIWKNYILQQKYDDLFRSLFQHVETIVILNVLLLTRSTCLISWIWIFFLESLTLKKK